MLLIKNAKVYTMAGQYLPQGDVLIDAGRIVAVDSALSAPDARVIDAKGLYALPGLVDAHCHIGMWDDSMGFEGSDGNEITDPVTPQMRALDQPVRTRPVLQRGAGGRRYDGLRPAPVRPTR